MDVSKNSRTPKSFILIGFSIVKPSILGYPNFELTVLGSPKTHPRRHFVWPGHAATTLRRGGFFAVFGADRDPRNEDLYPFSPGGRNG